MRCRNYKYFICLVLVLFGAIVVLPLAGCTDDPATADAKQIRQATADVLETAGGNADTETLQSARNKLQSSIVTHQQASTVTQDAARLASGNLALARGRRMQSELYHQTLPLRNTIYTFEKSLRSAEDLLLEKERIEGILEQGQQEIAQLELMLNGTAEQTGLKQQLDEAQAQLDRRQAQKQLEQAQKDKIQAVLDDYQSRADNLLRQAELTAGGRKLELQKQAYAILQDRKQYYIEAQSSEDKITALNEEIELVQSRVDNLARSVRETQQRINAIKTSETRIAMQQQLRDVSQALAVRQQQLAADADAIANALETFKNEAESVCEVFDEAAGEFERIRSRSAAFTASLQMAESYHQAALACSASFGLQIDTAYRLDVLLSTADPAFAELLRGKLSISATIDSAQAGRVLAFYDEALAAYQTAYDAAGAMGREAQCSVLKSQLLAVDSKMKLADTLNMPAVADEAQARRQELMEKGQEFGVSFTQSETRKLVEYGINYTPSLPVNLDVLAEQLTNRFTAWKQLPLTQREAAVKANLTEIEELIGRYGETLAQKLEPLRQEMLKAQERGFEEAATGGPAAARSGLRDPNNF